MRRLVNKVCSRVRSVTHFVIGGAVFLWGRGGVSTGAVGAVAAVALAVQAESDRGTGRGQRSMTCTHTGLALSIVSRVNPRVEFAF